MAVVKRGASLQGPRRGGIQDRLSGAGPVATARQPPPESGRSRRRKDHAAFCLWHSAFGERSSVNTSAARARAGSRVRVYSSRVLKNPVGVSKVAPGKRVRERHPGSSVPERHSPLLRRGGEGEGGEEPFLTVTPAQGFAHPGVGIKLGQGEELVAGLFDAVFYSQPVEKWWEGLPRGGRTWGSYPEMRATCSLATMGVWAKLDA